jgi:5-methylcytosine-specific restriction enzyme A
MPIRPPTDAQLRFSKRQSNQRYNAERVAVHGTDPRGTRRWRKLRAMVLSREPLCRDPYGTHQTQARVEVAQELDHIVGVLVKPDLAFDPSNLQPLCRACHARKSQAERAGTA